MKKRALLSVSDKTGIVDFARRLQAAGYEIISTGGTKKALEEADITVLSVEDITHFPECFSGRVKTMHPALMGGILFRRGDSEHEKQAAELNIEPIDLIAVNLYPFEEAANNPEATDADKIEQIDIGGPTLLRSAAKNHDSVTVICDPADYDQVAAEIEENGSTKPESRRDLATKVFLRTAAYDAMIGMTLSGKKMYNLLLTNGAELRYGENPHQWGTYFDLNNRQRPWEIVQEEKQMSYLNLLDADGAWNLVSDFTEPAAACIKHANPSGVAVHDNIDEAFQRSYDTDRLSAFGVIIALNRPCTKAIVEKIIEQKIFVEIVIAPDFEPAAVELFRKKPKIRVIKINHKPSMEETTYRTALGGMLMQNQDTKILTRDDLKCVTDVKPTEEQINDLLFAWTVVKHAKSNAIVFAKDGVSVGIGCGQTSRVDSTIIAARRAGERAQGAVMASDAFFPFADSIEKAAETGIKAIIQPGGSIRDDDVIAKANELNIPMLFTGIRGFRH